MQMLQVLRIGLLPDLKQKLDAIDELKKALDAKPAVREVLESRPEFNLRELKEMTATGELKDMYDSKVTVACLNRRVDPVPLTPAPASAGQAKGGLDRARQAGRGSETEA